MTPLLSVRDLRVHFRAGRGAETLKAVDGVSFDVARGETFGIIGESGSGKSTLGRAVVGLAPPTAGSLAREGAPAKPGPTRDCQIVFQDPHAALDPRMSVLRSVREPLDIRGDGSRRERDARALDMIARVGLDPAVGARYPHQLSGGQKQRVNIARTLTLRPKLVVCDEIVAALDVSIQADVLNLLADLQAEMGLTYLFITHDLGVVSHIADRIAVMYLGGFVELGPAERLTAAPLHPYTEALLSAEPEALPAEQRQRRRILLEGEVPSPIDPPSGCRFRTRCRFARDVCAAEAPAWREREAGHYVACHFAGEVTGAGVSAPA